MSARTARTLALFATVVAAFIGLAVALAPAGTAAPVVKPAAVHAVAVTPPTAEAQILTAALGAGADYTPEQATEILETADRVCEGMTAGVPLLDMADTIAAEQGITDVEAHNFVAAVAQQHCTA